MLTLAYQVIGGIEAVNTTAMTLCISVERPVGTQPEAIHYTGLIHCHGAAETLSATPVSSASDGSGRLYQRVLTDVPTPFKRETGKRK